MEIGAMLPAKWPPYSATPGSKETSNLCASSLVVVETSVRKLPSLFDSAPYLKKIASVNGSLKLNSNSRPY